MILGIKTASDETELVLKDGEGLHRDTWQSGRQLSDELLPHIEKLVALHDLKGIIVFRGPGSFTSLRIGITTANTLAYSLHIPIVGSEGEELVRRWAGEPRQRIETADHRTALRQRAKYHEAQEVTVAERTFVDKCIKDDQGRIVLGQNPNLSLLAFFVFSILAWVFARTSWPYQLFKVLAFGSIFVWCYLEIFSGVNYFRRALGLIVLVLTIMSVIHFEHL